MKALYNLFRFIFIKLVDILDDALRNDNIIIWHNDIDFSSYLYADYIFFISSSRTVAYEPFGRKNFNSAVLFFIA